MAILNTNASLKYKDIISKSNLIQSGSPALYQLKPKKDNTGTLTRMALGEKVPYKMNKTILLVGETGAGKSTLINALVNYAMGVEWGDDVWFQILEEEKKSQSESQTSDVIVYEIFGFEDKTLPYSLTIIDTPGFGDTRGTERDEIVKQRLFDLFRSDDGVHEISAVGLVLKASENRVSDRLSYIFNSVVSLFGKNMEKKVVALLTHSDGTTPDEALGALNDANVKCARNENNQPVHFLFNNRQVKDRTKDKRSLKFAYETTAEGMEQFTDFLKETEPQKLEETMKVLNDRIRLTACIHNIQERIEFIELKQREIQQTREALKKHEEEMKDSKNFTAVVDEPYKVKKTIDGGGKWWWLWFNYEGAVTCSVCEENCHYPGCTVAWSPKSCEVMKGDYCTSCTGKCHVSKHVKEKWRFVTKTRKVQRTLEDVKEKYEKEKADIKKKTSLLETLQAEMEKFKKDKDQWLADAFQHVVNLEKIALKVDSLSTHVHLDFLIEKMKEKGDTEKKQKLEEMKSRMEKNKGFMAGLRYRFGKALGNLWQKQ